MLSLFAAGVVFRFGYKKGYVFIFTSILSPVPSLSLVHVLDPG